MKSFTYGGNSDEVMSFGNQECQRAHGGIEFGKWKMSNSQGDMDFGEWEM